MIIFDNFDKLSISINEVLVPLFNVWRKQWFYNIYGGLTLMVDVCKQVGKILLETSQRKRISFTTCIKNYFILNMKFNTPPFSHVHCLKWFSLTFFFFFISHCLLLPTACMESMFLHHHNCLLFKFSLQLHAIIHISKWGISYQTQRINK